MWRLLDTSIMCIGCLERHNRFCSYAHTHLSLPLFLSTSLGSPSFISFILPDELTLTSWERDCIFYVKRYIYSLVPRTEILSIVIMTYSSIYKTSWYYIQNGTDLIRLLNLKLQSTWRHGVVAYLYILKLWTVTWVYVG